MINISPEAITPVAAILVLTGGLISGLSPCTLPTVVFVVGYVGGYAQESKKKAFIISLAFVFGLSLTLALTGALAAVIGGLFLGSKALWYIISGVLIIMGANLLGLIPIPALTGIALRKTGARGILGAFLLGYPLLLPPRPVPPRLPPVCWLMLRSRAAPPTGSCCYSCIQ